MESACVLIFAVLIGSQLQNGSALPTRSERVGIIDGKNASISQYPYIAAVVDSYNFLIGSGVILNETWILTTAFNVYNRRSSDIQFRVGSDSYKFGGQLLKASKIVIHKNYTGDWDNDIALVKVHKMKMGTNVTAAQLGTTKLKAGTEVKFAGWGSKDPESLDGNDQLLDITYKAMSWNSCLKSYPEYLTKNLMCTIYNSSNPTYDDLGDPLVHGGKVYGLWAGCSIDVLDPMVFVYIPAYIDWIHSVMKQ